MMAQMGATAHLVPTIAEHSAFQFLQICVKLFNILNGMAFNATVCLVLPSLINPVFVMVLIWEISVINVTRNQTLSLSIIFVNAKMDITKI